MRRTLLSIFLGAAVVAGAILTSSRPGPITLVFQAKVENEPLTFNSFRYSNPSGDGIFMISDFRFFVSNVRLDGEDESFSLRDSYHLLRFDNDESQYSLQIPEVPFDRIHRVRFSLGVDEAANTSIESVGDLDPNSRMAWNWEIGYKFVLLEGALQTANGSTPIVYHVGFSENRRDYEFELPTAQPTGEGAALHFQVNVMKLFNGSTTIDIAKKPSVIMDRDDARIIADNYASLISLIR